MKGCWRFFLAAGEVVFTLIPVWLLILALKILNAILLIILFIKWTYINSQKNH